MSNPPRRPPEGESPRSSEVLWHLDDFVCFRDRVWLRGWAFHPQERLRTVEITHPEGLTRRLDSYGLASPDVADHHGDAARNCRFDESIHVPLSSAEAARHLMLRFRLGRRQTILSGDLTGTVPATDPSVALRARFFDALGALSSGRVLELGARERSGTSLRAGVPGHLDYLALDILAGPGVDVVADAHQIGRVLAPGSIDAVFCVSVFEHILMPWKVVLELNTVLSESGIVFVQTHQTWPLHDPPCDYWRYSADSWTALFNTRTGFEVVDTAMGEPAWVTAQTVHGPTFGLADSPAYLASSVLARKVSGTELRWDVEPHEITDTAYPA